MTQRKHTVKILCTIGPASLDRKTITNMDELNVDIFRINLSHTGIDRLEDIIVQLKSYTNKPICLDSEGAQIRTGYVENGRVFLENNQVVEITGENIIGNADTLSLNPSNVIAEIRTGDLISIDFESLLLHVIDVGHDIVKARVVSCGYLGSNKAVNLDRHIALPTMSQKDKEAINIGLKHGINHFALSFTNCRADVEYFRDHVGKNANIICKVESLAGVNNIDEIIPVADAILIDRGDLSREVAIEKVPFFQKMIINKANKLHVPVYVATNLLESMIKARTPTRAEVSDVINTLLDGADGLVLAAETAIGSYPTNCVAMVSRLIKQFGTLEKIQSIQELHKTRVLLVDGAARRGPHQQSQTFL
jgi:pyruvate kinase